jgi:hypothetical protein
MSVWKKFSDEMPEQCDVALKLLSCHATSAATERNWSMWGKMYTSAWFTLGTGNAKALFTIRAHEKCKVRERDALALTLDVLEASTD